MPAKAVARHNQGRPLRNHAKPRPRQGRQAPVQREFTSESGGSRGTKYKTGWIDENTDPHRLQDGNFRVGIRYRMPRRGRQLPVVAVERYELIAGKPLEPDPLDILADVGQFFRPADT